MAWGFERFGAALDLSEEQAALQRGEQRERERVGIGVGSEPAAEVHLSKAALDGRFPPLESSGELGSCFGIGRGELGSERPDWGAAAAVDLSLVLDHTVTPGAQAIEAAQIKRLLAVDDRVGLVV